MLLNLDLPRNTVAMGFVVAIILSIIVTEPLIALVPEDTFGPPLPPITRFIMTALFSAAVVVAIWKVGTAFGGKASLADAYLVFAYLELVLSAGLAIMLVLLFVLPFLAGMMGLGVSLFWLWLLGAFYAEAFGFPSVFKALGVVALSWFATYVVGILILSFVAAGGAP